MDSRTALCLCALRQELGTLVAFELQALKIGKVIPGTGHQVIVSTTGGQVQVLDGATGARLGHSDDFGFGGCALAVADLDADGLDEVLFAPLYLNVGPSMPNAESRLLILKWATNRLVVNNSFSLKPGGDHLGYAPCGIAVGELLVQTPNQKHVVVTTMNGEMIVFAVDQGPAATIGLTRVYDTIVTGSLGCFNSIVIADLWNGNGTGMEIYVSGSMGIRRFIMPTP